MYINPTGNKFPNISPFLNRPFLLKNISDIILLLNMSDLHQADLITSCLIHFSIIECRKEINCGSSNFNRLLDIF